MARVAFKRQINVGRVVTKIVATIIGLYVGGYLLNQVGDVMLCTYSPFYEGLNLIGWTVTSSLTVVNSTVPATCNTADSTLTAGTYQNVLTSYNGSGVLAIVGLIAIASIVTEFVSLNF